MFFSRSLDDKYNIQQRVGGGSFAQVFKGTNISTGTTVAIKHIDIRLIKEERSIKYMFHEADLMKQLRHPNIVHMYESITNGTDIYLVFQYCSEGDLSNYLKNRPQNKTSEQEARIFTLQLIEGMDYLHENKIIHRDIKPQNILLHKIDDKIILKLADFGFAKELKDVTEMSKSVCGTPLYMGPELFKGKSYSIKADIWSLGLVIFEMVMGYYPFDAKTIVQLVRQINKPLKILSTAENPITPEFIDLIINLLHRDPNLRLSLSEIRMHSWLYDESIAREIDDFCIINDYKTREVPKRAQLSPDKRPKKTIISSYEIFDDWDPNKIPRQRSKSSLNQHFKSALNQHPKSSLNQHFESSLNQHSGSTK